MCRKFFRVELKSSEGGQLRLASYQESRAVIGDGDRKCAQFQVFPGVLGLLLWYGTSFLFLEQIITPSRAAHARTCCESFCGCRAENGFRNFPKCFMLLASNSKRCNMQMNHLYVSDFPFKNFCKLAKQAETMKNYQKHSFGYDWVLSWETHKLTRFQSWEFSYISFICKSEKCLRVQPARADIIHSQRRIEVCTKRGCLFIWIGELWNFFRKLSNIWSRNVTTSTREPTTCAWIRADICHHGVAICSKKWQNCPMS